VYLSVEGVLGDGGVVSRNLTVSCLSNELQECYDVSEVDDNATYVMSMVSSVDDDLRSVSYNWEMLWSVQLMIGDDRGEVHFGGVDTEFELHYDAASGSLNLTSSENERHGGLNLSGVLAPSSSYVNCSVVNVSTFSSGWWNDSYFGVGWFITDDDGHDVVFGSSSWGGSDSPLSGVETG